VLRVHLLLFFLRRLLFLLSPPTSLSASLLLSLVSTRATNHVMMRLDRASTLLALVLLATCVHHGSAVVRQYYISADRTPP